MRFLLVIYLSLQGCWASYGNSSSSNSGMFLRTERIDTKITNFIDVRNMSEDIEHDWYKRDENNDLLDPKASYKDNILKILIKLLVEKFAEDENSRIDIIKDMLEFVNDFIGERFIPHMHREPLKKVFHHIHTLQHKPTMQVTSIVFDELSEKAQNAFKDGVRVQTNGLEQAPNGQNTNTTRADPILVEILFMQLVWDAEKRSGTRQELLNNIEKSIKKMEQLFGKDSTYTIVGTFESLRSTLVENAEKESPLPSLIRFIISLLTKGKKELEGDYKKLLDNKDRDEWKEITKTKAQPAVSIWIKKAEPTKSTKEKEKKDMNNKFKNKINEFKEKEITKGAELIEKTTENAFSSIMKKLNESLGSIAGILG